MSTRFHRACVTGGAGFIGSHLVAHLLRHGMEVTVLDDLSTGRASRIPAGARFVEGSILDLEKTSEAMDGAEVLFHLAARVAIRSSYSFVVEDAQTNLVGTAAVLHAAATKRTIRRVILASSMAVYADSFAKLPVREDHPTLPLSPYGVSKLAAEQLTHIYSAQAGMESAVLRLFNTFGPGQTLSPYVGVLTIFVNQLIRGEQSTIFGDGLQTRDFVHVLDVVQGFYRAMSSTTSGETFNIGSGQATTLDWLYRSVTEVMQIKRPPLYAPIAAGELLCSFADISKAIRELDYQPRYGLAESLPAVIEEICAASAASV
ncbi:MAG: NAD-dependent epimerase/dehydratase family protein [Edaphobacter sp.]